MSDDPLRILAARVGALERAAVAYGVGPTCQDYCPRCKSTQTCQREVRWRYCTIVGYGVKFEYPAHICCECGAVCLAPYLAAFIHEVAEPMVPALQARFKAAPAPGEDVELRIANDSRREAAKGDDDMMRRLVRLSNGEMPMHPSDGGDVEWARAAVAWAVSEIARMRAETHAGPDPEGLLRDYLGGAVLACAAQDAKVRAESE